MSPAPRRIQTRRWLAWTVTAAGGLIGMYYGFDFGQQISGTLIGAVMAVNGALFGSILASAAVERLLALRAPKTDDR
ncbi:MAG: hypothetical protein U5L03_10880 [Burkholderiaceae bacterium]|nr:hypothetical protein [Burkholderiaceae bacterium]